MMSMTSDRVMVGNGLMTALSGIVVCGYFLFSTPGERLRQSFHSGYPTIKVPRLTGKENICFILCGNEGRLESACLGENVALFEESRTEVLECWVSGGMGFVE